MAQTILRLPVVRARTGLSRSTIYLKVSEGSFPRPISLGARSVGWVPDEDLYEQTIWPSAFNSDHKSTFRLDKPSSWSPSSYELRSMCENLPNSEIVSAEIQDSNYDHSLRFPLGIAYKRRKPLSVKWSLSVAKRIPIVGWRAKRFLQRRLVKHGFAVDQTAGDALAQIQIIARKLA